MTTVAQMIWSQMYEWVDPQSRAIPRPTASERSAVRASFRFHIRADGVRIQDDSTNPRPMTPVAIYIDHKSFQMLMEDPAHPVNVTDEGPKFADLPLYVVRAVHPHIHVYAERE